VTAQVVDVPRSASVADLLSVRRSRALSHYQCYEVVYQQWLCIVYFLFLKTFCHIFVLRRGRENCLVYLSTATLR